ncbi:MAG: hypothetical protein AABX48_01575 [Nanoarchaeota archaeon]
MNAEIQETVYGRKMVERKQPILFCVEWVKSRTNALSISPRDKYFGEIRRQYNALVESSGSILKEVERLEGIIYSQFLNHLKKGQIYETSGFNISTAHVGAGYPIFCPRTEFKEFVGYPGEIHSAFGLRSVEQIVYDEMEFRSRDKAFREKIKIPQIKVPSALGQSLPFEYDSERWKKWNLNINSHQNLPHVEADFWIPSY